MARLELVWLLWCRITGGAGLAQGLFQLTEGWRGCVVLPDLDAKSGQQVRSSCPSQRSGCSPWSFTSSAMATNRLMPSWLMPISSSSAGTYLICSCQPVTCGIVREQTNELCRICPRAFGSCQGLTGANHLLFTKSEKLRDFPVGLYRSEIRLSMRIDFLNLLHCNEN